MVRKVFLLLIVAIWFGNSFGQLVSFEEVRPELPLPQNILEFDPVGQGTSTFLDVDNDNDMDVLITGRAVGDDKFSKLYINDGVGNFIEQTSAPFDEAFNSAVAFSDIDNDNDLDILIVGANDQTRRTQLYTNDGAGNFTLVIGTPFTDIANGDVAFADVDNDNDQDVVITGSSAYSVFRSELYLNDGNGNFSLEIGTPFTPVWYSSISFADVDNDNDQDLLITGATGNYPNYNSVSNLYLNDGTGSFSLDTMASFEIIREGDLAFADIDNDNDLDLLMTGVTGTGINFLPSSKLYKNDGNGNFTEITGTPFDDVAYGSVAFADIDSDNDMDVMITGHTGPGPRVTKLYTNDGLGTFSLIAGTTFSDVRFSSVSFGDVDNDNDLDVLITGRTTTTTPEYNVAELHLNDGNGVFTLAPGYPLDRVCSSSIFLSDINNDNEIDLVTTGVSHHNPKTTKTYLNDGVGNFSELSGTPIDGVSIGSIALADVDNDYDNDLLVVGEDNYGQRIAKIYLNNGNGDYTEATNSSFLPVDESAIAFNDIDNDNDQDLLITGWESGYSRSRLYLNDGNGNFTWNSTSPIHDVSFGAIAFGDIDNDNAPDLILTGSGSSGLITKIYTNDGNGNFTEKINSYPLFRTYNGTLDLEDVDNDGDLDFFITGQTKVSSPYVSISKLYLNDGTGDFSIVQGTNFTPVDHSAVSFSDLDKDSDPDLLITGNVGAGVCVTKVYLNDGTGSYTELTGVDLTGVYDGDVAIADVDNDSLQDLIITGKTYTEQYISKVYKNTTCFAIQQQDVQVACNSFTWIDGITYTVSNNSATYTYLGGATTGCDSIVALDLTIYNSPVYTDTRTECDSLVWIDGNTYTSSNNSANYTIPGGCLVNLDLTILNSAVGVDTRTECDSLEWIDGNTYTSSNNTATFNIIGGAMSGCDSLVTLDLTIVNSTNGVDNRIACDSLVWIDGISYTSSNSTALHLLQNTMGCDSLVALDLTINNSSVGLDIITTCESFTWIDGVTYNEDNDTAIFTMVNSMGCDSVISLDLTVVEIDTVVSVNGMNLSSVYSGATYQWLDCNNNLNYVPGEEYQTMTVTENGSYAVEITDNNCVDTSGCYSFFNVSITENDLLEQVLVYPSPNDGWVTINLGELNNVSISVCNVIGQIVHKVENLNSSTYHFELDELPGVYIVVIIAGSTEYKFRIVRN